MLEPYQAQKRRKTQPEAPSAFDSLYMGFVEVGKDGIQYATTMFETEPLMRIVTDITLSGLLGGGILFSRNGRQLMDYATDFYSYEWCNFTRKLVTNLWVYGFAGVVIEPHEEFVGIPRVLDIHQVQVMVRKTLTSETEYIFFDRRVSYPALSQMQHGFMSVPITGVMVFEMDSPSRFGFIRSKIMQVARERQLVNHILQSESHAASLMSSPALVIQTREAKGQAPEDNELALNPLPPADLRLAAMDVGDITTRMTSASRESMNQVAFEASIKNSVQYWPNFSQAVDDEQRTSSMHNPSDPFGVWRAKQAASSDQLPYTARVILHERQQLARQMPSTEPRHLPHLLAEYEQHIGALFGVPRSMFSGQVGNRVTNPDTTIMFHTAQRDLKQRIIPILTACFNAIHADHLLLESIVSSELIGEQDVKNNARVEILLPGVPPLTDLHDMYHDGILKYEAYKGYITKYYGMSVRDFYDTPKLDLHELNGTPDVPEAAPKPKPKSKPKPKPKAKPNKTSANK